MSEVGNVIEELSQDALEFVVRAAPWRSAFERLLPLLETGQLTEAQLTVAVEAVMLSAKREQIRRGEP